MGVRSDGKRGTDPLARWERRWSVPRFPDGRPPRSELHGAEPRVHVVGALGGHVAEDGPFPSPLIEGAKGVQLAEACHRSHAERRWIDLEKLAL